MSVRTRSRRGGFTLVELLVVIGIIAVLIGILLPALSKARASSWRTKCLANIRSLQIAQTLYASENRGFLVQAGFSHGGHDYGGGDDHDEEHDHEHEEGEASDHSESAWFHVLQRYGSNKLLPRCPADTSPHWRDGDGVPISGSGATAVYRQTSYGINEFLDKELCPWGPNFNTNRPPNGWYVKISQVRRPSVTIQFLEMAYTGEFSAADHPHIEVWGGTNAAASAADALQINAHGGKPRVNKVPPPRFGQSVANYGFLDGHAESLAFDDVFRSFQNNKFDPAIAQ